MDGFKAREHAAEARFAHEQDQQFMNRMKRVRNLAFWASQLMSASAEASLRYEDVLVQLAISKVDDGMIISRVRSDLEEVGIEASQVAVNAVLNASPTAIAKRSPELCAGSHLSFLLSRSF